MRMSEERRQEIRHIITASNGRDEAAENIIDWIEAHNEISFSQRIIDQSEEESNLDDPHFAGETYEKPKDQERLNKQLFKVFDFLMDEKWHTQQEIADSGINITSIRSRLSDLRMPKWGAHTVLSERVRGGNGLWRYKLIPNKESLTYKHWFNSLSVF